jgi:hypothetical protein
MNDQSEKPKDTQWPDFNMISHYRGLYTCSDYGPSMLSPVEDQHQIGIGFETKKDGEYYRAAVRMTDNPDMLEIMEAMEMIMKAFNTPNSPQVRVVKGSEALTGAEMITSALQRRIKVQLAAKR